MSISRRSVCGPVARSTRSTRAPPTPARWRTGAPIFAAPALLKPLDSTGKPDATIHADRRLGMTLQKLDPDLAESLGADGVTGVLVSSVLLGGPAGRAGVKRGDILRAIDGRPVLTLAAYREAADAGGKSLTVWRGGPGGALRAPLRGPPPPP